MAKRGPGRPFKKGEGGRPKGVPNKATLEIKEAARKLLEDEAYLAALKARLVAGEAGPVEPLLYHYAYGKPRETVEIDPKGPISVVFGGRFKPGDGGDA